MSYTSAQQDPFGSYIVTDVCIHNPENIYNRIGSSLYGVVIPEICNITFGENHNFYDDSESN